MEYTEVYSRLCYEAAFIVFFKKDGSIRLMLGTRNLHIAEPAYGFLGRALGGRDNRCNRSNGNIALIDLSIGEVRTLNIDRLVSIEYRGIISDINSFNKLLAEFLEFKRRYEETQPVEKGLFNTV